MAWKRHEPESIVTGRPPRTETAPTLLGLLVDVSGSMITAMSSERTGSLTRLQSVREGLDRLVERAADLSREGTGAEIAPRFHIFALGFGFGGPLAWFRGDRGAPVRDLLALPGAPATVPISVLAQGWSEYREHIEALAGDMLGDTPMLEAFATARRRFRDELFARRFSSPPILFVLSDGEPNNGTSAEVLAAAEQLKAAGVLIVSCLLTDKKLLTPRRLYTKPVADWTPAARLMFDVASPLQGGSPFHAYLREYGWEADAGVALFTQINQTETLSEFLNLVLSPADRSAVRPVRVFVTYSHADAAYLGDDSLLGYLKGLRREGFQFWTDDAIVSGEQWDHRIRREIDRADIVLALVSQRFLDSEYSRSVEIKAALRARRDRGAVLYPILLSACDWHTHKWLADTQFQPRGGKSLESDFQTKADRDELFLEVLQELRAIGEQIRAR
jgi:hypothetical protein